MSFEVEIAPAQMWRRPSATRISMFEDIKQLKESGVGKSLSLSRPSRARKIVLGAPWQAFFSLTMVADLVVLIMFWKAVLSECIMIDKCWYTYLTWGLVVTLAHGADTGLRVVAFGWVHFRKRPLCLLDLIIFLLSVASWTIVIFFRFSAGRNTNDHRYLVMWIYCLRILRMVRLARQMCMCPCRKAMVYGTAGSKRRFIDLYEDFDLDLTYVTGRVIAMSVPIDILSQSCCRNLLSDVARFFDTRHRGRYIIVNACPELPYPSSAFQTGIVARFDIQDHTPPTMEQFLQFIETVWSYMRAHPDNTLGVHCKAGKGRTGSLICAWLLYTKHCENLQDALACFALARSDFAVSLEIFGVETPSQVRYLAQFAHLCNIQNAYEGVKLKMPEKMEVRLICLKLHEVWKQPPPSKLVVAVHQVSGKKLVIDDGRQKDNADIQQSYSHVVSWSEPFDVTTKSVPLVGTLEGDVRISIFDFSKLEAARRSSRQGIAFPGESKQYAWQPQIVAGTEPGCLFYFLFHTAFLDEQGILKVTMGSDPEFHGMDKAWKKTRMYNMHGYVELQCSPV